MKKLISIIIIMCLMISSAILVSAENINNSLYIKTKNCPNEAVEYAKDNVDRFVSSVSEELGISIEGVTMGTPFTVSGVSSDNKDIHYFPVMLNGELKYLFSVYLNDNGTKYTGSLSNHLVKEINAISRKTSLKNPVKIFVNNGNIYYEINNKTSLLFEYFEDNDYVRESLISNMQSDKKLQIINALNEIMNIKRDTDNEKSSRATKYKYIKLSRTEEQGSNPWCAAYATAAIVRTKNNQSSPEAEDIIKYFHPNSKDLTKEAINDSEVKKYGRDNDFKTKYKSSTLSHSSVKSEINSGNPIYLSTVGEGSYKKGRHALVLRGYSDNSDTYSVWNPWDKDSYVTIDKNDKELVVSGGSFTWEKTVYNWEK